MLSKASRITAKEWKGIKTRLVYRGAFFDISISPSQKTKYACVISKKRIKRAVDRNKTRRKIYSALEKSTLLTPCLVFIYPTKTALYSSQTEIREDLIKVFATLQ